MPHCTSTRPPLGCCRRSWGLSTSTLATWYAALWCLRRGHQQTGAANNTPRHPIAVQIKTEGFHGSYDPAFDTYSLDDDSIEKVREVAVQVRPTACHTTHTPQPPPTHHRQLLDFLEPIIAEGGTLVDFHTVDFFPERFFDLVLVLRADNTTLYDRLVGRYVVCGTAQPPARHPLHAHTHPPRTLAAAATRQRRWRRT